MAQPPTADPGASLPGGRVALGSPPVRALVWVLRAGVVLLCAGVAARALDGEGDIGEMLIESYGWSPEAAMRLEAGGACLLLAMAPLAFWRRAWPSLFAISAWAVLFMMAELHEEGSYREFIPGEHASRYLGPVALALLSAFPREGGIPRGRVRVSEWVLRAAAASTFVCHGVQAVVARGRFQDFLFLASERVLGMRLDPEAARAILLVVGTVDVLVAIGILVPAPMRLVAGWMAFWGLATAASRIVSYGRFGIAEALIRAIQGAVPIGLFLYWHLSERAGRDKFQPP